MTQVQVETISLQVTDEPTPGVAGTVWEGLQPDNITSFGVEVTTIERRPISPNRQTQEGIVVNREGAVEYETDLTGSLLDSFLDHFVYAQFSNFDLVFLAAPVLTTGFTIPSATANQAGKLQFVTSEVSSLVFARGYPDDVNNGMFDMTADVTASDVLIPVAGQGLVLDASPPINARLEIAGIRSEASDLSLVVSGTTATLTSAGDITDWETTGLIQFQEVYVGGLTSTNQFAAGHDFARIASFAGSVLNLDKIGANLVTDTGTGVAIDILFGQFVRNVSTVADTDGERFINGTQQFELAYPRTGTDTLFEYTVRGSANTWVQNFGLNDKVTTTVGYVCTDSEDVGIIRKTGADVPILPTMRAPFGTGDNIANLRTSAHGANDEICFKSLTVTFANNATPESCLGETGARSINVGIFQMTIEAQAWFTGALITNSIRNNTTITMEWQVRSTDSAVAFDVPSMKLGGGGKEFPRDQTVMINTTATAFENQASGTSIGVTTFPAVPPAQAV